MSARLTVTDDQRRARLMARHHLGRTAEEPLTAVRGLVALHASDPATPYLSAWARVPSFTTAQLDEALYVSRTLRRMHAMRRTQFVVPADETAVFDAAAAREVARKERRRLETSLAAEMPAARVTAWLAHVEDRVQEALADGRARRTRELTAAVGELTTKITLGSGRWSVRSPVSSRLLFLMAMEGRLVRARPVGTWRSSQYRWAASATWPPATATTLSEETGRVELARRYLASYGPVTLTDLRWWTGWTVKQAQATLRELKAVAVALEDGGEGFVLDDDLETDPTPQRATVGLLPGLDPTPMGWTERGWYLGEHRDRLFDRNGNVGPTVWVDGRVVGGWAQRPDGHVTYRLLDHVGRDAERRIGREAAALTGWLGGVTVTPRFRTPLERELSS